MRHSLKAFLVSGLVLAAAFWTRADDASAVRALIDKAVKAQGGEARLAKWPAVTAKLKGTYHGLSEVVTFTGEFAAQGPDRYKFAIEAEADGQKFRLVEVLNGDKGWVQLDGDTEELDKEDLAEAREEAYGEWVATLVPLKDKAFTLALLGEVNIDKRPARGITVSSKGHRDVNLYFDKETGLLVKTETRVKDDGGQEVTEETFLGEYKEVQSTKQATKVTVKRDGKLYLEYEVTDYQLAEKLDDSVFAKP
jgi:outer membrane lipoprotein-sorting protein